MNVEQIWQLLDLMPDAVVVMSAGSKMAFANRRAAVLLGYESGELIGQPLEVIIPNRFRVEHAERSKAYLANPAVRPMNTDLDLWALRKDGQEVPVDISLSPIHVGHEKLVVATLRDVSHRRETELALRQSLMEVESLRERLSRENLYLREEVDYAYGFEEFVGRSDLLKSLLAQIEQVATTDTNVLILGETGTGKELVARAIHHYSRRKDLPLVKVNCAALSSSLIESELFGHDAGAFTGALTKKIGRFELADGGTIFLDEIGDLGLDLQAKLLRIIQEGEFERVGSSTTRSVDVRIVAATNRDLPVEIQQGRLRPDLYFRLAVFAIQVPTLRARRGDIPLLVWYFVAKKQSKLGKKVTEISDATMDRLVEYPWPGNIRELENVIERAIILSPSSTLAVEPLLDAINQPTRVTETKSSQPKTIDSIMRDHIAGVLKECHWRIKGPKGAAERLGINPSTLRYRMKKLGIKRP